MTHWKWIKLMKGKWATKNVWNIYEIHELDRDGHWTRPVLRAFSVRNGQLVPFKPSIDVISFVQVAEINFWPIPTIENMKYQYELILFHFISFHFRWFRCFTELQSKMHCQASAQVKISISFCLLLSIQSARSTDRQHWKSDKMTCPSQTLEEKINLHDKMHQISNLS